MDAQLIGGGDLVSYMPVVGCLALGIDTVGETIHIHLGR